MKFIKVSTGAVLDELAIRAAHPHTSFPTPLSFEDIDGMGYQRLSEVEPPPHEASTHFPVEGRPVLIDGVWTQTWSISARPVDDVAAIFASRVKAEEHAKKMTGVMFDGVMCSATKDDQAGLLALWVDYASSPASFTPTRFEFSNGNALILTRDNISNVRAVWGLFRRSFFSV